MTRSRAPPPPPPRLLRHPTCARAVAKNGRLHLRVHRRRTYPKRCVPFEPTTKPNSMTSSLSFSRFAPSASADKSTTSRAVPHRALGMTNTKHSQNASGRVCLPKQANSSVRDGRNPVDARKLTDSSTSVQVAEPSLMGPRDALELRTRSPQTPYRADTWEQALRDANLFFSFIDIPSGFRNGFIIDFPTISYIQSPPNKDSFITYFEEFKKILDRELVKERYIGPFSLPNLEETIGPFQSSPLSIIPKPGRPGKFRVVQNFSYPRSPSVQFPNPSINSFIQSEDFPTTWGKFSIVFLLISRLPPESEAAMCDVAEAYRTIPLHPSQWPAAVVRASDDDFYIDTCTAFGATPSAGIYGRVADAGAEILRSRGIGPLDKWVDDHVFFRIKSTHLSSYNNQRASWARQISNSGGLKQSGSRLWYPITNAPGDSFEEFNENCTFPLRNLSRVSTRSKHDTSFTYAISDIDDISDQLGIPWERSKDQPFDSSTIYIGFKWDLDECIVSLAPTKVEKYLDAIREWSNKSAHVLKDVQTLYGKLLHASAAIPRGRTYLTGLEWMVRLCIDKPFMPH
jgi:hypothetical protein